MPVTTTALPNDGAVLDTLLSILGPRPAAVLDLGGGTGVYAVPLARNGHRVQVLDQSNDALWALARRAQAEGVGDRVQAEVADLDDNALIEGLREARKAFAPLVPARYFDRMIAGVEANPGIRTPWQMKNRPPPQPKT